MSTRRGHAAPHENHERWLVSYADFITLLFAFFVVMFATANSDKQKAKAVSQSVQEALENGQLSAAVSMVFGRGKKPSDAAGKAERATGAENAGPAGAGSPPAAPAGPPPHAADLAKSLEQLEQGLAKEIAAGKIGLKLEGRGLVISLREAAFFNSGDDAIAPASIAMLEKISREARGITNPIRLEGHSDSLPIHNSRFRSNWDLSAARAIAMMELLRDRFRLPPDRMSVAGYAENAPVDTNDTAEGRARNRRVDLVLLSAEGEKSEPKPVAPPVSPPARSAPQTAPAH